MTPISLKRPIASGGAEDKIGQDPEFPGRRSDNEASPKGRLEQQSSAADGNCRRGGGVGSRFGFPSISAAVRYPWRVAS